MSDKDKKKEQIRRHVINKNHNLNDCSVNSPTA